MDMKHINKADYFECFAFGNSPQMADELLELVLAGKKTATVSVILEDEPHPQIRDVSLVLNGKGEPACTIRTIYLETVRFCDLTWEMVRQEGEDETFEQWKTGNYGYWMQDAAQRGYIFTEETMITFEQFEVVEIFSECSKEEK